MVIRAVLVVVLLAVVGPSQGTSDRQKRDVQCTPGGATVTYLRDPDEACSVYFMCLPDGRTFRMSCAANLHFSLIAKTCVRPSSHWNDCVKAPETQTTTTTTAKTTTTGTTAKPTNTATPSTPEPATTPTSTQGPNTERPLNRGGPCAEEGGRKALSFNLGMELVCQKGTRGLVWEWGVCELPDEFSDIRVDIPSACRDAKTGAKCANYDPTDGDYYTHKIPMPTTCQGFTQPDCKGKADGLHAATDKNCSQYFDCSGSRNIGSWKKCPNPSHHARGVDMTFNPRTCKCTIPCYIMESDFNDVKCPGCISEGSFEDPTDCKIYHVCSNGIHTQMKCSTGGTMFNVATGRCDWPANLSPFRRYKCGV